MWQRFTERTRRVIFFTQEAAAGLGYHKVAPEHLLIGLIREEDCIGARVLRDMGVRLPDLREELSVRNPEMPGKKDEMELTRDAKRAIDLAYEEARLHNDRYIGTEHLLLGLLRVESTGEILSRHGVELEPARKAVSAFQGERPEPFTSPSDTE